MQATRQSRQPRRTARPTARSRAPRPLRFAMILRYPHLDLPSHGPLAAAVCAEATRPPGSSAELRAVAAALSRTAQALRDTLVKLQAISADDSSWSGAAAESFRAAVKEPTKS